MKPNLFHTQFFRLFFLILLAGISIQTYAAKDSQAAPKKRTITGTVISEGDNMPIIGANVWLKNSSTGAITDLDGKYSITIDNSVVGGVLVFSYIGMSTQEVAIGNQNVINVTLKFDTEKIDEVVVVGYGHQKKASVIGSISTIDMAGVKVPGSSISSVLAGQLAGVVAMNRTGEPGKASAADFYIRGVSSFTGGNTPLVLVDGIERDLDLVDVEDIASFSILKDASASAVYGVRGANGVILITTKRGKSGKPRINYNGYVSIQNPTMLQDLMSSYDYARLYDKARVEYGLEPRFDKVGDGKIYEKFRDGSDPYNYPNTDWYDLAYRTGFQHNHNVNVSGGTDNLKYMASVGYLHQDGTLPNAERQQFNGRMNLDVKLNSRLNVRVNMAYINNDYSEPNSSYGGSGSGQIVMRLGKMAPWIVGRYEDGTWGTFSDGSPLAWLDVDQTVRRENQNFSGTL